MYFREYLLSQLNSKILRNAINPLVPRALYVSSGTPKPLKHECLPV